MSENLLSAISDSSIVILPSRYNTEEKRKRHAEYQRKWRKKNVEKVKLIGLKSRQGELRDPARSANRKRRIKASRQKPDTRKLRHSQKTRRYQKTQHAMNSHRRWSVREIQIAFDRDLTDVQIGAELGRSVQAVAQARIRHADRAPVAWIPKG